MSKYNPRKSSTYITALYIESDDWDLYPYFDTCTIYEDIFKPFMMGEIYFADPIDMTTKIPLTGGQTIKITFKTNDNGIFQKEWTKEFKIYKIDSQENDTNSTQKSRFIRCKFISAESKHDLSTRISRSFMAKTESDIVSNICENILGISNLNAESTKYSRNLIVPNWTSTELIDYCCRVAVRGSGYEAANYIFYEDIEKFNFVSLDSMIEKSATSPALTHNVVAHLYGANSGSPAQQSSTRNVSIYTSKVNIDMVKNSKNGMWGTRYFGLDLTSKKYKEFDWVYSAEFDAMPKIDGGNKKLTDNAYDSPEQLYRFGMWQSKPRDYNSDYNHKHAHKRAGMMQIWDNYVFHTKVEGDSNLKVGDKIPFDIPNYDSTEIGVARLDDRISGNYIITEICNVFSAIAHVQHISLRKPHLKT